MEYHHHQPSAISRKLSNSGGVTGNHVYDGVFGRPEKLGSRTAAEDYREIFSGSSSCSIPMLDVPELNEGKICVDARSSRLDYNKIFGGFGDDDFGVSHEELFKRPKEGRSNTSRQVRSSAESRQRSRRSGHSNISEDAKQLTPEVPLQFDGVKQFNVSYNRSNSGVGSGTNGTMRIAQLGATPGYTCVVDEVSSTTQMLDGGKLVRSGLNDSHPSVNISESVEGGKPQRKVVSGPQPSEVLKTSSTKVNVTERGEGGNLQRKVVYGPQPSQVLKTSSTRVNVNEGTEGGNLRRKFVSGPQPSEFMKTSYTKVNISEQVEGGNLQTKVVSGPQPTEVSNTSSTKVNISERVGGGDLQRKVVSGPQPSEFLKTSSPKVNVSERVEGGNLQRKVVSGHQPSEVSKTSYAKVNVERVGGNLQRKVVSGPQPSELLKTSDTKANASERIGGNLQRKVVSGPQSSEVLKTSSPNCTDIKRRVSRHRSISDDLPLEEFELGVEPHPTRKSLHSRNMSGSSLNAGVSHRFMYSDVGIYRMDDHEGAPGSCSPPLFEEDGDVNSTAASSAAAVRKAIEEAQAKIKLAKELMEKRKGFRNRVKVGFSNGLKADRREDISAEMSYGFNDEPRETLARKGFSESFIYHTSQNIAIKNNQETPNFQGKENSLHATHRGLETCKPEPKSAQVDLEVEESMDGNREPLPEHAVPEGERASELEFMLAAHKMNSKSSSKEHSGEEDMRAAEISERPKDYGGELTTPRETLKEGKIEKVLNTVAGAFEWVVYKFNSPSSHEHHYRSEHEDTGRLSPEPEQAYQTTTELEKQNKARKELTKPADENAILVKGSKESMDDNVILNECGNLLEKGMKQEDINVQAEMQDNLEGFNIDDTDGGVDENGEQPDNKMGHRETSEAVKYVKEEVEREQEDDDEKECEQLEINDTNKLGEVLSQEVLNLVGNVHLEKEESMVVLTDCDNTEEKERHKKLVVDSSKCEEIPFNSDKEKILDEIQCPRENETVCDKANGSVECPNKQEPDSVECSDEQKPNQFCVENNKKDTVVLREEDFKNFGECSEEVTDGSFDDTLYINEPNIRYVKNDVIVGQGGLDENDKLLEEFSHMNDTEARLEKTCERTESEEQSGIHQETEDGLNEASQQSFGSPSEVFKARPDECEVDSNDTLGRIGGIHEHRETLEKVEITVKDLLDEENERTVEETENSYVPKEFMRVPDTVGEANEMEEENCEVAGFMGINEMQNSVNVSDDLVSGKKGADLKFEDNVIEFISIEEKHTKEIHCSLDKNEDVKTIAIGFESEGTNYDDHLVSPQRELLSENESDSTSVEEICKVGSRSKEVEKPEVLDNHGDNEDSCETSQKESGVDDTTDAVVSQKFHLFENNEKTNAIVQEKTTAQITNEKEENHHETLTIERKADDTLQKESDLERKQRREKEEAKAREMEKEKERIAVERAIREARERAFAEARERAEKAAVARAAVEAQQRLKAETQKRLEKVSSGLNDKSSSEKAAIANKLKAERAAVERATAEARERALERAMSEKKQRNQGEKVTGVSGDNISRSNDKQSRDSCRSSSNNDAPCSTETFANANGESGIRCKATMERLQRTAERAAKALAEKNKRDLLVQKEQEERNRLAEVLDAEVKRWSSGKERNLRALLSTLQYILGPDSGWQAISLTELISSAAVKKAYRKATLFVHPDKLQQRGASIQQKYTCEKVFDLLKEAWNKFSAEER